MNEPYDNHPPCSAKAAAMLYAQLEYYRAYMPSILKWSEEQYAATQEAKNADAALDAYRRETGAEDTYAGFSK